MRKFLLGLAFLALALPAEARNFAVPEKNPAVTLRLPDTWKSEEIEYGFSAKSPDGDMFFSVESASKKKLDAMLLANKKWMKENEIDDKVKPEEREMDFNGTAGQVIRYNTTDLNGKTIVDFVILSGGENQVIMITLWGSEEERAANKADIAGIMNSVRPIQ
ncbi:hypothetical protein [Methylobacterium soli]|uniref:DUF1795 domain-containing protein n=1 Tax=Methylobacterium soli TaxID=553447 RepID=A0A6L3T307_9HYPH|nr:hypothetical protein [Methylobacterium soli]KAB1080341.1 hypothetical protein F6X53_06480 [Methylobacterium soli]GJE41084.1 hypothetical protein AEGHOMDF_0244 [Methylobacterium soli]